MGSDRDYDERRRSSSGSRSGERRRSPEYSGEVRRKSRDLDDYGYERRRPSGEGRSRSESASGRRTGGESRSDSVRRSSSGRSSSGSRPSDGRRPSSGSRSSSQRRPDSSRSSGASRRPDPERRIRSDYDERSSRSRSGSKKKKMKAKPRFYIICGLGAYLIILLIISAIFLGYVDRSLKKYEKSQSSYAIEKYMDDFNAAIAAGQLPEGFVSEAGNKFESEDVKLSTLLSLTQGKTITCEKDPMSYNTEEPVYDIKADGDTVAKVTLTAVNPSVILGILTIMDWEVKSADLTSETNTTDYYITAPEGYAVSVNGVSVDSSYLTGEEGSIKLFENASEYVSIPSMVQYKIPSLSSEPTVVVTNPENQEVLVTKDGNNYAAVFGTEGEMPQDLKDTALNIAETWSLFNTADLSGGSYGLATVRDFLIPDSFYDGLAKGWAGGIDITFTSAHTLKNPPFENVTVDQFIQYTPDCFSCHICFDKPMHLTRTGEDIVDSTHSTYLFVRYDGKWCLVDMIADTEN